MSSLDQCAKKVVSDSQWPVDFVIGLVDSDPGVLGIQFSESLKTNVFLNFQLNVYEPKAIFQGDPTK